jgi:hypothetical protein
MLLIYECYTIIVKKKTAKQTLITRRQYETLITRRQYETLIRKRQHETMVPCISYRTKYSVVISVFN